MSNLLAQAIAYEDGELVDHPDGDTFEIIRAAARRLLDATEIRWCGVHNSNWPDFYPDDSQIRRCRYAQGTGIRSQCSIVPARLIVEDR
jgi:hypothetical protein